MATFSGAVPPVEARWLPEDWSSAQMEIVCVGGGPAGLYFALAAKARNADHRITVLERNPANVTHGWGVTFGEELLDSLHALSLIHI